MERLYISNHDLAEERSTDLATMEEESCDAATCHGAQLRWWHVLPSIDAVECCSSFFGSGSSTMRYKI